VSAPLSLAGRLSASLIVLLGLTLGALFWSVDLRIDRELYSRFDRGLSSRIDVLAAVHGVSGTSAPLPRLERWMPEFAQHGHTAFYEVWDANGRRLARSESAGASDLARPSALAAQSGRIYYDMVLPDGHAGRAVAQRFALPAGDPRIALDIVLAEEREALDALEDSLHFALLGGIALALLAVIVLLRWIVRRALAPVHALGEAAVAIDPDGAPRALQVRALPSELSPMASKFNDLLARLFATIARERRFARNLAHELRTPMAETRAIAEVALMSADHATLRHALGEIAEVSAEMERVVESLLALARQEAGLENAAMEPVELSGVLREQLRRVAEPVSARALSLQCTLPPETWVLADAAGCERIVANLLGNAVAHAPEHSTVSVSLRDEENAGIVLRIGNPAPALSSEDMQHLGERFYRGPAAPDRRHAGLGLALAHALALAQGLPLSWRLDERQWLWAALGPFKPLPDADADAGAS
jgi:two-component system sensor histidine kinase QseC